MAARNEPKLGHSQLGIYINHAAQMPGTWAGGTTSAIYAYPRDTIGAPANAQLWVGTAVIERSAAYSYFPGRTRVHLPIHGNGIRLHFQNPAETITLSTFAQYHFDGARPLQAELIDGAIVAFNLIVQNDVAAEAYVLHIGGHAVALDLDRAPAAAGAASVIQVVYAVNHAVALEVAEQPTITLHPGDAFVFHPRAVAKPPGANVRLQSLESRADVVVATLVFGGEM